jgi:hypothetical protein
MPKSRILERQNLASEKTGAQGFEQLIWTAPPSPNSRTHMQPAFAPRLFSFDLPGSFAKLWTRIASSRTGGKGGEVVGGEFDLCRGVVGSRAWLSLVLLTPCLSGSADLLQ